MQSMRTALFSPGYRRFTWVHLLIGANILVFVLQLLVGMRHPGLVERLFALSGSGIKSGHYWQFLSYMFLHGGVLHLLVNCLGLAFAGREVETQLGARRLLTIYFVGGILGGIAQLVFNNGPVELLGASGGVCAVLLAFTTMMPEAEITALLYFIIPVRMRAKWLGWGLIGVSLFFIATGLGRGVGHLAHLGGALFGWFYVWKLGYGSDRYSSSSYGSGGYERSWFQRKLDARREDDARREAMDPGEFISREIDPILDKISREGIHSLTKSERRILEQGREKIARRTQRAAGPSSRFRAGRAEPDSSERDGKF